MVCATIYENGCQLVWVYLPVLSMPPVLATHIFSYGTYMTNVISGFLMRFKSCLILWFLVVEENMDIDSGKVQVKTESPLAKIVDFQEV